MAMDDWGETNRHLGPSEPPRDAGGAENNLPGAEGFTAEDDFDPRYCIHCHKRIPRAVSDRQSACDECLEALKTRASRKTQTAVSHGKPPPCPECGSEDVEHEWQTDWVSKAVDVTMDVAGLFFRYNEHNHAYDPDPGAENMGTPRVLRYHCRACGAHWKPKL